MSERKEKFTPGPWEANQGDPQWHISSRSCLTANTLGGNDEANAHLIAAAPELYDIANRIYELLIHPTAPITAFETWELGDVLSKCRGEHVERPFKVRNATGEGA